jgi:sec-independent protein translocase protein TatC
MGESETGSSEIPGEEPPAPAEPYDPELDGPPDDEELPLTQHIEEMVGRLLVVLAVIAVVSGIVFPFAEDIITFLWFSFLPGDGSACPTTASGAACPRVYHPLGLILARLKVASLAGFVIGLPVLVYESYLFMRPGLYPRERRYYLASVPTSLVLAGVGIFFAYFLVLPAIFTYFLYYSESAAEIALSLSETFDLMVIMLGLFAVIFQIPLFIMLAIMMGVTTRRWLVDRRLYFWAGFAGIAFLFNPDPTGMAPFVVTATMIALFEGTLLLLKWTGSTTSTVSAEGFAGARPYAWGLAAVAGYLVSSLPAPGSYYGAVPAAVFDGLAALGLATVFPAVVTASLLLAFEGTNYLLKRQGAAPGLRDVIRRVRIIFWIGAIVAGYLASESPPLLARAGEIQVSPAATAGVALGIVAAYEVTLAGWRWYENRERET